MRRWLYCRRPSAAARRRLGRDDSRPSDDAHATQRPDPEGLRVRALLSVATAGRHLRLRPRTSRRSASSSSRPTGPASTSPRTASRSRSVAELTGVAADARRPGQDVPPRRSTPGSSPGATSPSSSRSSRREGIEPIDIVVVNVQPFGAEIGRRARRHRRGDRDDRRRRRGAARRRGPQSRAGVVAVSSPRPLPAGPRRARASAARSAAELRAQLAAEAFGDGRRVPRRDRGLPQPARRHDLSRSASRWSSRRSATCATARTRTRRPPSTGRRPIARPASRTPRSSRARQSRRSTTCSISISGVPDREQFPTPRWSLPSTLIPSGWHPPTSWWRGVPPRARDRPGRVLRQRSWASNGRSTGRLRGRSPRTGTRRSIAPGFDNSALGILRQKAGLELLARPAGPDRGHARLRHRPARLQARRRRPARRDDRRRWASTAASSRSSRSAARRSRS